MSNFGTESYGPLTADSPLLDHARSLGMGWLRLGSRISWRTLQPYPGSPIQWDLLDGLDMELYQLKGLGISPVIVVTDTPLWATNGKIGGDGQPSTCAAMRPERLNDFAEFMRAIVNRYKTSEFNVHDWELGNEPDVDPSLVPGDSGFGCWGDESDPFYGGRQYGEMLKVVTPVIKAEDPGAQVWIGGLLLAAPTSYSQNKSALRVYPELLERGVSTPLSPQSHPETFFKGILEAGAGPYFDVVAYHWYPSYYPMKTDFDLVTGQSWDASGGGVLGKASFLRGIMKDYGISKPLSLNETGLGCLDNRYWCNPPDEQFYQAQADYLVRSFVRGLGQDIIRYSWYTLEGPGWRYLGLLDSSYTPMPSYIAYQQLGQELKNARFIGTADYGDKDSQDACKKANGSDEHNKNKVEVYEFTKGSQVVQVLWACEDQMISLRIPSSRYISARTRDGAIIPPSTLDGDNVLTVGFDPIYLTLQP